jgi:glutamine---fructose-6-phosphate transaminase (isomerizing)
MAGNIQEIKARKGPVIAIVTEGDSRMAELADDVITIPPTLDFLNPVLRWSAASCWLITVPVF